MEACARGWELGAFKMRESDKDLDYVDIFCQDIYTCFFLTVEFGSP